jgi:hypothetical protein
LVIKTLDPDLYPDSLEKAGSITGSGFNESGSTALVHIIGPISVTGLQIQQIFWPPGSIFFCFVLSKMDLLRKMSKKYHCIFYTIPAIFLISSLPRVEEDNQAFCVVLAKKVGILGILSMQQNVTNENNENISTRPTF